jgi:biopolymer transport protein ExbD
MAAKVSGGGKGRYQLGQNADINVTPFVDVMLVLLIIFMVSAPLATLAIKIDLPPAETTKNPPKNPTYISIARGGVMNISGVPTTLANLGGDLTRKFAVPDPQKQTVMIRADRDVRYSEFMGVVNQLQTDGFFKVGLIAEEAPPGAA